MHGFTKIKRSVQKYFVKSVQICKYCDYGLFFIKKGALNSAYNKIIYKNYKGSDKGIAEYTIITKIVFRFIEYINLSKNTRVKRFSSGLITS